MAISLAASGARKPLASLVITSADFMILRLTTVRENDSPP
jgi:hypothetical protein